MRLIEKDILLTICHDNIQKPQPLPEIEEGAFCHIPFNEIVKRISKAEKESVIWSIPGGFLRPNF